jgi:hypothetical protein
VIILKLLILPTKVKNNIKANFYYFFNISVYSYFQGGNASAGRPDNTTTTPVDQPTLPIFPQEQSRYEQG